MSDLFDFLSRVAAAQNSRLAKERKVFGGDWKEILPESSTHNLSSLCPSILRPKHLLSEFCQDPKIFHTLFLLRQISFSSFFSPGKFLFQAFFSNKFLSHAFSFPTNFFFEQVLRSICHQIGNFPSLGAHCRQFYTMIFRIFSMIFRIIPQWFLESTFDDFMTFSVIFRIYFQWFFDPSDDFRIIFQLFLLSFPWFS